MRRIVTALVALAAGAAAALAGGDRPEIVIQTSSAPQVVALLEQILPRFTAATGVPVRIVVGDPAEATARARNGEGDLLLTTEAACDVLNFIAGGWGVAFHAVMYEELVVVGPAGDPAGIAGSADAPAALNAIREAARDRGVRMVAAGDGLTPTYTEAALWAETGSPPAMGREDWYRRTGLGMAETLELAARTGAYVLTDRASWAAFRRKSDLAILFQGDPRLFTRYGVTVINPTRFPAVRSEEARVLIGWITSPDGQEAIAGYRIGGAQVFFPNAEN